jgi:hypothetical protein
MKLSTLYVITKHRPVVITYNVDSSTTGLCLVITYNVDSYTTGLCLVITYNVDSYTTAR